MTVITEVHASRQYIIVLISFHAGNLLMELIDHKSIVRGVSFTSDGSFRLVSCSNDCTLKFWDFNHDGNMYKTVRFNENVMLFGCKWSPNVQLVAAVGMSRFVSIYFHLKFSPCLYIVIPIPWLESYDRFVQKQESDVNLY